MEGNTRSVTIFHSLVVFIQKKKISQPFCTMHVRYLYWDRSMSLLEGRINGIPLRWSLLLCITNHISNSNWNMSRELFCNFKDRFNHSYLNVQRRKRVFVGQRPKRAFIWLWREGSQINLPKYLEIYIMLFRSPSWSLWRWSLQTTA